MAIQFPNNPGIGSVFTDTDAGFSYEWDGTVWKSFTPAAANNIKKLDDISSGFDNSTTTFNLTILSEAYQPRSAAMLQISLGGVIQEPSTDYTVSFTDATITFTTAPAAGLDFFGVVRGTAVAIDYATDGNVQTKQEFTATEGQTSFTVSGGYSTGYVDVFRNGVRLGSDDFTDTSGTAVVLTVPAQADDLIETVKYNVASLVTTEGQFVNLNITGVTTVGVVTGATSIQSGVFYGDGSGLTGVASTDNIQTATDATFLANVNVTGITTSTGGFVGALTGNATGLSGSPDITVTNVTGAAATFSGNVSIGGTLTYQDVTNVDSVGIITARSGIIVTSGGINATGIITSSGGFNIGISSAGTTITSGPITELNFIGAGNTFAVNGTTVDISTDGGTADIADYTSEWTLGANGTSDYTFSGNGFTGAENDPTLYLVRGQKYKFTNNMGAHPFRIQSTPNGSTGTQYNDGITNNDVSNGTLTWNVQFDTPDTLYYQCTAHPDMGGIIYIGNGLRNLPQVSKTSAYTLIATDTGKHIGITTGGVTVPSGVFSVGDAVSIYNNSTSNQTITQGSGVTLRQAGTSSTGNRTLAQYGLATLLCVATNTFVISGGGLS